MYHVSAQGVDERMINVHYYYSIRIINLSKHEFLVYFSHTPSASFSFTTHGTSVN